MNGLDLRLFTLFFKQMSTQQELNIEGPRTRQKIMAALNKFESEYEAYNFLNSEALRKNMNLNNPNTVSALIKDSKLQSTRNESMMKIFKPAKDRAIPGDNYSQKMLISPSQDYDVRRKRYIESLN